MGASDGIAAARNYGLARTILIVIAASLASTAQARISVRKANVADGRHNSSEQRLLSHESAAPQSSRARDGIIASDFAQPRWWGFPSYAMEDNEDKPRTWAELILDAGRLGRNCMEETAKRVCGFSYVCKEGVCKECEVSRDCNEKYRCKLPTPERPRLSNVLGIDTTTRGRVGKQPHATCVPRDPVKQWTWREIVCTVLVVITALFSAAAGMGGGGVYVPLLLMLLQFSTKEAVPLSQAMIVGGATVNVAFAIREAHPLQPGKPKIDYNVIMMLNPGMAAGVTLGIILHMISPQWLMVLVLLVTLAIALQKSLKKGLDGWAKESKLLAQSGQDTTAPELPAQRSLPTPGLHKVVGVNGEGTWLLFLRTYRKQIGLICGCWSTFFLMNLMKAPQCTSLYWMQQFGMLVICAAFTVAGACTLGSSSHGVGLDGGAAQSADGEIVWSPRALRVYPLLATAAGFLGGFLGIGGGIVLGPLLLELGMVPQASQATSAAFVFLSSSLATIQFTILGKEMPEYGAWFTSWVVVATLIGQSAVEMALKRWNRPSVIVLSVAAIVAFSLVMMTAISIVDVVDDFRRGATDWGFSVSELCQK